MITVGHMVHYSYTVACVQDMFTQIHPHATSAKTSEEQRCVPRSRGDFVPEGMEEIAQLLLHSAPSDSVKPLATGIRE